MLIGIVGKSNVGKSTFFKALTLADVGIAPYPFTTIEPNEGVAYVKVVCPDKEFNVKCSPKFGYCIDNYRFVPIKLLDVAGLVPGAHLGRGRGNAFLDDLRQADVLIHVVDASGSTNAQGEPIEIGSYDPTNDVRFLEEELDMWYLGILKKTWDRFARQVNQEQPQVDKAVVKQFSGLGANDNIVKSCLIKLKLEQKRLIDWDENDLRGFARALRQATKPMIIAANKIDVNASADNTKMLKSNFPNYKIIPCSAESELALKEAAKHNLIKYIAGDNKFEVISDKLNPAQKKALEFIQKNVLDKYNSTGVEQVLDEALFKLLNYIVVFPIENENKLTDSSGRVLPDAYLMPHNSTPLDLAFKVHTDIGNKFSGAIDAKTKKRLGKDYLLKNCDVIKIITN